jgi:hypothetical protein
MRKRTFAKGNEISRFFAWRTILDKSCGDPIVAEILGLSDAQAKKIAQELARL